MNVRHLAIPMINGHVCVQRVLDRLLARVEANVVLEVLDLILVVDDDLYRIGRRERNVEITRHFDSTLPNEEYTIFRTLYRKVKALKAGVVVQSLVQTNHSTRGGPGTLCRDPARRVELVCDCSCAHRSGIPSRSRFGALHCARTRRLNALQYRPLDVVIGER